MASLTDLRVPARPAGAPGTPAAGGARGLAEGERHAAAEAVEAVARAGLLVTDVIRTPSRPHGTTHSNGCRSLSTLTAKPWVVTPRETWMPIEAILRSSTQTPVSPSRGPAAMPSSASAATIARSIVRR